MVVKMSARSVAALQPIPGRRAEYHDSEMPGLSLRITESGARSWSVLYRHRGRLRRLTLGTTKVLSLADARERARDVLTDARDGKDPATIKLQGKQAETVADLAAEYIEKHAKRKKKSWREDDRILRSAVLPVWRHRAIADITRRDVRRLVETMAERAPVMANRTAALISRVFKFALDQELIEVSPAVRIARPGAERERDRVLTEDEIRTLWAEFTALPIAMAAFYKLRLLTAQRGGEVTSMRWSDIDLERGWWTIPAEASKNGLSHRVPLLPLASQLLAELLQRAPADAVWVIDGARGRRQQSEAAGTFTVADFRGHDLRRTAASMMTSAGVPRLVVSKILNHVESGVTKVYDRHSYDREKEGALLAWETNLLRILG